jgi:hypothetical protein
MTARWVLIVTFDPPDVQEKCSPELAFPYDECSRLIAFIGQEWDLLPEEIQDIATWNPSGATLQLDQMEFVGTVLQWLAYHTVPQTINVIRNEER